MEDVKGRKENQGVWKDIAPIARKYMLRHWLLLSASVICGAIAAASAALGIPKFMEYVVPVVFDSSKAPAFLLIWLDSYVAPEHQQQAILWVSAAILPAVMMLRGLASFFNTYFITRAGMQMLLSFRVDVFAHLQHLSISYHEGKARGEHMTTVLQNTQMLQQLMVNVLNDLIIQPLTLIFAVVCLVSLAIGSEQAASLLGNFCIIATAVPLVRFIGRRVVRQMRKSIKEMGGLTSCMEESLSAQREVRAFNLQERQIGRLKSFMDRLNSARFRLAVWQTALGPSLEVVSTMGLAYALYQGASSGLTLPQFTAIATALYYCYDPIKRLGMVSNQFRMMEPPLERIQEILHAHNLTPEPVHPQALPQPVRGEVCFNDVNFSYDDDRKVLSDINLRIPAGQIVALVGPSGAGKTTLINLICRFYDVDSGSVSIDGIDVRQLTKKDRTSSIALVSQFAALFHGSIRDNIRVGRPSASDAEIEAAGQKAHVAEFALNHSAGYDRELSEGGTGLSGGQKQRVSIARAFIKAAPIIILDEATSALDMKSEAAIQDSLEELAQGRTTFIIAHRFSTIRKAERILVFNEGRIMADGTHPELYAQSQLYRSLYDEQQNKEKAEQSQLQEELIA